MFFFFWEVVLKLKGKNYRVHFHWFHVWLKLQDPDVLPVESEREGGGGGGGGDERTELLLAATFLLMVILRWYWQNDVAHKSKMFAYIPSSLHPR